ncbi:hypothetical protein [Nocardioides mesophilus]|uniref:Uncharacterized protein n=1 Tax=Nocardioides mesophilus TaxID=433659 RepID=A0A7G9RB49_9ACTN|nr:hypothetical protein [Nocardioides mesophilus]QNN52824.1 hypothetical protein H9L09_20760 [Nocardioides mesophilus]
MSSTQQTDASRRSVVAGETVANVLLGASGATLTAVSSASRRLTPAVGPLLRWGLRAPVLPRRWRPERLVLSLDRAGATLRERLVRELVSRVDVLLPGLLAELVRRGRLTELLVRDVDLDAVVAAVDLDAVAARLDVDAVAARLDVDAVVARADLDAVAARLDVDAVVARADLDAVVNRLDVDAVVGRVDVDAVVNRLDVTSVVLDRVDLDRVVAAVLAHVEEQQLLALAEMVVEGIDLPEIIRDSSGAMATDTVRGARMRGVAADEAIARARDRIFFRGQPARNEQP